MPSPTWLKAGLRNVLILLIGILPLFLILAGIMARAAGVEPRSDVIGNATVLFPWFLLPMTLGGLLYLTLVFQMAKRVTRNSRLVAVILSPTVAVGFLAAGMGDVLSTIHFLIALLVSGVVYGLLIRIPTANT